MKVLSIECSAVPCSVTLYDTEKDKFIAECYRNCGLTHSETLMPMISEILSAGKISADQIDAYAIASGPGSFTGIRIGISTLKGLAAKNDTPSVGVSTLKAIAYGTVAFSGIIVSAMDARRDQFYSALFLSENGKITRITKDTALSTEDICDVIESESKKRKLPVIVAGDGAEKLYSAYSSRGNILLSDSAKRYQSAYGVALAALDKIKSGDTVSAKALMPKYLRLPQAERELREKNEGVNEN